MSEKHYNRRVRLTPEEADIIHLALRWILKENGANSEYFKMRLITLENIDKKMLKLMAEYNEQEAQKNVQNQIHHCRAEIMDKTPKL